jgi:uncharacterized protein (DUF2147 family)
MVRHIKSPRFFSVVTLVAILLIGSLVSAGVSAGVSGRPSSPVGNWSTENGRGVVAIEPCGDALCGRIVGIDRDPTEPMPTDVSGRSQCGLTIIRNQKPTADGSWVGEITDPRDGRTWQATLWVDENGNLHLRGFIGIPLLGATQIWRPFGGHLTAQCGLT